MPGSYAHITLVNEASEKRKLAKIEDFPAEAIEAANLHLKYLELGCISPDYPYLDIASGDSKLWADEMHYTHTGKAVYIAAERVRGLPPGIAKDKCLTWLMGYSAHVTADMCIHPVVELKVGPYKGNETAHRKCEMHQDAYIFRRMGTEMPQISDHVNATILTCGTKEDPEKLDNDIRNLWENLLKSIFPAEFEESCPDLNTWHKRCHDILCKILPTTSRMVGFARHVCDGLALSYPRPDEVETEEYINNLKVPSPKGVIKHMSYDEIFDFTIKRIRDVWRDVTRHALGKGDFIKFQDEEWNLDTGRNVSDAGKKLVFWEVT